jgi:hypothetical protein
MNFHGRTLFSRVAALVCLSGLGLSDAAFAQAQLTAKASVAVAQSSGYVVRAGIAANDAARTYSLLTGAAGIAANESLVVAARAGPLALSVVSSVTSRAAIGAAIRCVSLSVPVCAAGAAAALLYSHYRARVSPSGGLMQDVGLPPQEFTGFKYTTPYSNGVEFDSAQAAADDAGVSMWRGVGNGSGATHCDVTPFSPGSNSSGFRCYSLALGYEDFRGAGLTRTAGVVKRCVDPSIKASGDGNCASGVEQPTNPGALETHADNHPLPPPAALVEPLKQAVAGGQAVPAEVAVTGPAQVVGPKVQTQIETSPQGVTKTEVQPVEKYQYLGDKVLATSSDITTVTHPDGSQTVTTSTTKGEAVDPCVENPSRLGCLSLGDPPTEVPSKVSRELSFSAESVSLPSGCPAPSALTGSLMMSWQPACDAATAMRPYVLVGAAFTALLLLLAGVRQV